MEEQYCDAAVDFDNTQAKHEKQFDKNEDLTLTSVEHNEEEPVVKPDIINDTKKQIETSLLLNPILDKPEHEIDVSTRKKPLIKQQSIQPKTFRSRWMIVCLFAAFSMSNAYQWIHLNIIFNVIHRYYNESLPGDTLQQEISVHWLSMIYMLVYIPLICPVTWLLEKKGLRVIGLIATFLNALGAWIKCAAISPDRFAVLMTGQTVSATAQVFILGLPARIAAVWFGADEVSTATSIGVLGNQLGCAIGFLLPPIIVPDVDDFDVITYRLTIMLFSTAGYTTLLFILVIFFYKKQPPIPPSHAQILLNVGCFSGGGGDNNNKEVQFIDSLRRLVTNGGFVLLMLTYGMNAGSYYAIGTLLNPMILHYFPGEAINAGRIGLTLVVAGVIGSFIAGLWLDKTKLFKLTTVFIYLMSFIGMLVFAFALKLQLIWVAFICSGVLGFFMTGYLPVGFEFAAEITYPESEGTSSGLLNACAQLFGVSLTLGMGALLNQYGPLCANLSVVATLLLGFVGTVMIKTKLRRQEAAKQAIEMLEDQLEVSVC